MEAFFTLLGFAYPAAPGVELQVEEVREFLVNFGGGVEGFFFFFNISLA